ncbi:hypothetical protein [uncultured Methylobacterium sp.]|uniref:hypothetical protein n=1 Tax=uncultured Methylobacterium sp. TaxID=157278 RepID=UPI0035CB9EF1
MRNPGTRHDGHALVLGLFCIWAFSLWQLTRAIVWGVIWLPARHGGDRWYATDGLDFWIAVYVWVVLGPFLIGGTATFLWFERNDPV